MPLGRSPRRRKDTRDRTGRKDDDLEFVKRKLAIFQERTSPILDHYRGKGVRICMVQVKEETGPADIVACLVSQQTDEHREQVK